MSPIELQCTTKGRRLFRQPPAPAFPAVSGMESRAAAAAGGPSPATTTEFKIVLLGDKNVGKTCLVQRFVEGYFSQNCQSTIGAFFLTKRLKVDGHVCKLQVWDTAGSERFRSMAPMYYRSASCAVCCYAVNEEETFCQMKFWVDELRANIAEDNLVLIIAATKVDLEAERVISKERAEQFALSNGAILFETSAKNNVGVQEVFEECCREVLAKRSGQQQPDASLRNGFAVSPTTGRQHSSSSRSRSSGGDLLSCC
jgi:small GTP-binding protein